MQKAALCALGQTAPNPILSTMTNYMDEYTDHIKDKRCRSGKCKNLLRFTIDAEKCIGCSICAKKCPVNCIFQADAAKYPDKKKPPYWIDSGKCIKCGECLAACKFNAVLKA
jgi:formate hydrogenlyase subunit 6/NADH:ubiquinone oxidoreductase subunit I